jgi:hypothetical protein
MVKASYGTLGWCFWTSPCHDPIGDSLETNIQPESTGQVVVEFAASAVVASTVMAMGMAMAMYVEVLYLPHLPASFRTATVTAARLDSTRLDALVCPGVEVVRNQQVIS